MAEEFEKYKRILKREDEEFKEVMRAKVSISLPSHSSKQKMKDTTLENTCYCPFYIEICTIFF